MTATGTLRPEPMRVFVSGKLGDEEFVRYVMRALTARGYESTLDWTALPHLAPYEDNIHESGYVAQQEIDAVLACDALVLLAHPLGVGMFVELGAALAAKVPVFAVSSRSLTTMFLAHPGVRLYDDLPALLVALDQYRASIDLESPGDDNSFIDNTAMEGGERDS